LEEFDHLEKIINDMVYPFRPAFKAEYVSVLTNQSQSVGR